MTDPVASCELIGRWRIVEADLWGRGYLDMVEPAYLQIGRDGWAEFAFGCVTAGGAASTKAMRCPATDRPNFRTTAQSRSSSFDNGDDAILTGRRE